MKTSAAGLRREHLSFRQIPHQSRLFLDFLESSDNLREFYPTAIASHVELGARVDEVLNGYSVDRDALADALREMNARWNYSAQTLANIESLREKNAVAVVTGQQAGLFGGSLYTIYKALSIIKTANCLKARGINAVPLFWIASEDHDFAEVAETFVLDRENKLAKIAIQTAPENENLPVGNIRLDESIERAVEELFKTLPHSEFTAGLRELIDASYQKNETLSDAFGKLLSGLFADFGLILLDPLDAKLKSLVSPIYVAALEKSGEIVAALNATSRKLTAQNYHAQVLIEPDSFPFFWFDDAGKRRTLRQTKDGKITVKNSRRQFTIDDLRRTAVANPERFSPNATLRATVQDFLLPTIAYFGGAAEIAYFGQTGGVNQILNRPVTPILPRAGATIITANIARTLEKYDLNLPDFFVKSELLSARIVERFLQPEIAGAFDEVAANIDAQLDLLEQTLFQIEPTLSASLTKRKRKISYHIAAVRRKFQHSEIERNATVNRRLENAFDALFPRQGLQERTLNLVSFLARHDRHLLNWLYDAVDLDARRHQIIYL